MQENFRKVQRALEAGNDALFEVSRLKLSPESVNETRQLITDALAALVRLEAQMLRQQDDWTHTQKSIPLTGTTKS